MNGTINLIVGPSSCGKSTFIKNNNKEDLPVFMLYELIQNKNIINNNNKCIIHYNSLWLYKNNAHFYDKNKNILDEPILDSLFQNHTKKLHIYLLKISKAILLKRVADRKTLEPDLRPDTCNSKYPNSSMHRLIDIIDHEYELQKWIELCSTKNVPFTIIDSK